LLCRAETIYLRANQLTVNGLCTLLPKTSQPSMKNSLAKLILSATLLSSSFLLSAADLYTGLVSYWAMDVNNSGTTPDGSFTNDLTVVGAPTSVPGQVGSAFLLNGSSDWLTVSHGTSNADTGLPIYTARRYTVTMWVKGPNTATKALFTEGNTGSTGPIVILQTGSGTAATGLGKLDVILRNDQGTIFINHGYTTNVVAFDNTWHHIGWVDDAGACKMYIDGNVAAVFNYTPSGTMTVNNTTIGALIRTTTSMQYNASFDEVAIWERALTLGEIQQVRTNGLTTPIAPRAPILTSEPVSAAKALGDWALFSTTAFGNRPLQYQWFKNGSPITDATNRTYQVTGLTTNNSGESYSVVVSNSAGFVTTSNAVLTVLDDPAPNVANGLVNYWPLDFIGQSGPDLFTKDYYSGNDMLLKNFVDTNDFVAGHSSNALAFDFVQKYGLRNSGTPIFNSTNYSVALWVQGDFTGQNDRRVFSEGSSTGNNPLFSLGTDNANPPTSASATVFVRNDAGANAELVGRKSTRPVFDNTWHHLVWTDANGKGKLYVDGTLDETDYNYTRGALTLNMTVIGAAARSPLPVSFYFGNIDEVVTWRRVLSWTEIQQVMTNGIPPLSGPIPAGITIQPQNRTNYNGDTVAFTVVASGTQPLFYQWVKNTNTVISVGSNPSAQTDTLLLTNVQAADSNTFYSVVVTNAGGAITSSVARLAVLPFTPATTGDVLKVDFGLAGTNNAQPGFAEMTLAVNPAVFTNAVGVTLAGIGTPLADRNRNAGAMVANNPPYLTQAQIYNDFIFANNSTTDGTGLSILIERLAPNTRYGLTIWSFDPQSAGARFSDWFEVASGTTNVLQMGYTFDANIQPTNDFEQTVGGLMTSSSAGKLQIIGLRDGGSSFGVFVDALRLEANPIPTSKIVRSQLTAAGTLRISAAGNYPGQPIGFQQNTNLIGGAWIAAGAPSLSYTNGNVVTVEFPITEEQLFYRAVTPFTP
jgi:hypothetical protein